MALCQICGFEFYEVPKVSVNVILVNDRGEILMAKRKREPFIGTWNTLGGHVNPGETAEEAARREVKEESGLIVKDLKYHSSYSGNYPYQGIDHKTLAMTFFGKPVGRPKPGSDIAKIVYFRPEEIEVDRIPFKSDREALRDYIRLTKKP